MTHPNSSSSLSISITLSIFHFPPCESPICMLHLLWHINRGSYTGTGPSYPSNGTSIDSHIQQEKWIIKQLWYPPTSWALTHTTRMPGSRAGRPTNMVDSLNNGTLGTALQSGPKNDSIRHIDGPGSIDCVPCWANPKRQTTNDAVIRITFPLGQIGQMCHCPVFRQNLQETGSQNDSTNIKILNQNLCIQSGIRPGLHSYDLWDFLFLPAFDWARFWCVFLRWMWDVDLVSLLVYSVSTRLNPWTGRQSFMQPPPPPPSQARDAAERLKTRQIALEVGLGADYMFDGTLCLCGWFPAAEAQPRSLEWQIRVSFYGRT